MSDYSTRIDGKWIHIHDLEECLSSIRYRNEDNEKEIKSLIEENKRLREENYKDNELSKMKSRLDKMQKDYLRGFPISEEEEKAIEEWTKKHDEEVHGLTNDRQKMKVECCCGGRYSYHFISSSIGVSGTIKCACGAEFEFQEMN